MHENFDNPPRQTVEEMDNSVGSWVPRPIRCEHCNKIIEGTVRDFTFYCDPCTQRSIAMIRFNRNSPYR